MGKRCCLLLAAIVLGLGALAALPSPAADNKVEVERIATLVKQLGSNQFEEREKATQQLDAIGAPALEGLRKAAKSDDLETRMRAEKLIAKIESRLESAKLLAPTRLRLVCKDTPVAEAVQDLAKKSKYTITLYDPEKKLADRKVTLDTGEVSFWEAFDQLCKKANLVVSEGARGAFVPGNPGLPIQIQPLPPQPAPLPIQIQPIQPIKKPLPAPVPDPVEKEKKVEKNNIEAVAAIEVAPSQPGQGQPGQPGQAQPGQPAQAQPALPVVPPPGGGPGAPPIKGQRPVRQPVSTPDQIVLVDGKPQDLPTCYSGSARVRAVPAQAGVAGKAPKGDELGLSLEVCLEPKLRWQSLVGVHVEKAIDDQAQKLVQGGVAENPAGVVAGIAVPFRRGDGLQQLVYINIKKGEKKSAALKELTGTITAQVQTAPEAMMTVDNVLKAAGQTIKGTQGGFVKIVDVSKDDKGVVKLQVQMELPANLQPAGAAGGFGGFGGFGGGGIQIQPVPIQIQPLPPAPKNPNNPFFQQPAPAPVQIQIQIAPANPGAADFAIAPSANGFTLVDDKGQNLPLTMTGRPAIKKDGDKMTYEYTFTVRPQKGKGDPAKLVFTGSRVAIIEIPFTLKDVPTP